MVRYILCIIVTFSFALSGCAPAVQAQRPAVRDTQVSTSLPAATKAVKSGPTAPAHTPTQMPHLSKEAAFGSSALASVWEHKNRQHWLYLYDPISGSALADYAPISLGGLFTHALSPDRRTLAVVKFKSSERPIGGSLMLVDLRSWKEQEFELGVDGYVGGMVFDPAGQRVAILHGTQESHVLVFDLKQQAVTAQGETDMLASNVRFTSNGDALMLYGTVLTNRFTANEVTVGPPKVQLLDASSLDELWSADLEGVKDGIFPKSDTDSEDTDLHQPGAALYFFPGLAFAPDQDILYVVHSDEDRLTRVDFTGRAVTTVDIRPALSWFERLLALTAGVAHAKVAEGTSKRAVISPDGQTLYVLGQSVRLVEEGNDSWLTEPSFMGLQVIRVGDGTLIAQRDTKTSDLSISPDGRSLYLRAWSSDMPWTEVFDIEEQAVVDTLQWMGLRPAFSMDGEPLLLSSESISQSSTRIAVVDPHGLDVLSEWDSPQYFYWLSAP